MLFFSYFFWGEITKGNQDLVLQIHLMINNHQTKKLIHLGVKIDKMKTFGKIYDKCDFLRKTQKKHM